MPKTERPQIPTLILSVCLLFLGVNGLIGGYLMLKDPNGTPMDLPVNALERTPFQNYVVPGLWLVFIWGAGSAVTLIGLWLRPNSRLLNKILGPLHEHWGWIFSIGLGAALFVWLTVQLFTLPAMAPIQYILYGLAALLVGIPMLPRMRHYYQLDAEELAAVQTGTD